MLQWLISSTLYETVIQNLRVKFAARHKLKVMNVFIRFFDMLNQAACESRHLQKTARKQKLFSVTELFRNGNVPFLCYAQSFRRHVYSKYFHWVWCQAACYSELHLLSSFLWVQCYSKPLCLSFAILALIIVVCIVCASRILVNCRSDIDNFRKPPCSSSFQCLWN